ncbi:MAG: hypothetical protein JWP34_5055 [Massilia sp.]|nr:hypothetical protein [Massilia sp.]
MYVSSDEDEKVDGEKTKENGSSILATGGTCEFIGKEMLGTPVTIPTRSDAIASRRQDAMTAEYTEMTL